eukprot:366350-Chlamydomonas_euryale.AAC.10
MLGVTVPQSCCTRLVQGDAWCYCTAELLHMPCTRREGSRVALLLHMSRSRQERRTAVNLMLPGPTRARRRGGRQPRPEAGPTKAGLRVRPGLAKLGREAAAPGGGPYQSRALGKQPKTALRPMRLL